MESKAELYYSFNLSIQKVFCDSIRPFVHDIKTDTLGNVIAHKRGNGKKLMLVAHADEVALMVTAIDNDGFLRVKPSGGIDASILPARKINIVHDDTIITGIIGKRPYHLQRPENESAKVSFDDLWVDIGAKDKAEALTMIELGDYAYYDSTIEQMPNGLITGKALDDRAGLDVILQVAEAIHGIEVPWDIYFVASVQEELGGRGATTAARAIHPDFCIAIDVTHATDYPSMNPFQDGDIKLNGGFVLAKGPNIDRGLFKDLKECADSNRIAVQIEAIPYPTGTDANWVQITNEGVCTAVISVPCRYMHTPYEIVSKNDMECAIDLLICFLKNQNINNENHV